MDEMDLMDSSATAAICCGIAAPEPHRCGKKLRHCGSEPHRCGKLPHRSSRELQRFGYLCAKLRRFAAPPRLRAAPPEQGSRGTAAQSLNLKVPFGENRAVLPHRRSSPAAPEEQRAATVRLSTPVPSTSDTQTPCPRSVGEIRSKHGLGCSYINRSEHLPRKGMYPGNARVGFGDPWQSRGWLHSGRDSSGISDSTAGGYRSDATLA